MKTMRLLFFLLTGLLLWSCKAPRFAKHPDWSVLNGTYYAYAVNKDEPQQHYFDLLPRKYYNESPNTQQPTEFNLTLRGDSLFVSYKQLREGVLQDTTAVFKGKKKRRWWKYYLSCKVYPFYPLFLYVDIDKLRIGLDENGDLLVNNYYDREGAILILSDGHSGNIISIYQKKDKLQKEITYPFTEGDRYGIKNGQEVVTPPKYQYIGAFINGFALMEQNNKWGTINEKGEVLIPPRYDALYSYSDEHAFLAKKDSLWGVIDEKEREKLPFAYEKVQWLCDGGVITPIFLVKKGDKWGILNKEGGEILPPIYDEITQLGWAYFSLKKDGKEGRYFQQEGRRDGFIPAVFTRFEQKGESYYNRIGGLRKYWLAYQGEEACFVDAEGYQYKAIATPKTFFGNLILEDTHHKNAIWLKGILYEPDLSTRQKIKD